MPQGAAATLQAEQGHWVQDQIFWEPKFFKKKAHECVTK